jgi:hypothetical protein
VKAENLEWMATNGNVWRRSATVIEDGPLITIGQKDDQLYRSK